MLAIPTTYAGSEMTTMFGLTEGGAKRTGRDPAVLPRTVIYDPELTLGLPFAISVVSAINAIAHAAEGLYAPDRNPVVDMFATDGIARLAAALPRLAGDPRALDARGEAMVGAWMCGIVMGNATVGLHHKLCHTLGGSFGLPHAELHTVVLPHALAYNAPAAPEAMRTIAAALGAPGAPRRACSSWPRATARRPRCRRSACARPTSTAPPSWRCWRSTRTRGRSSAGRCASCCSAPGRRQAGVTTLRRSAA